MLHKKSINILLHIAIWGVILMIITLMPLHPEESFSFAKSWPFIISFLGLIAFFYLNANFLIVKLIPAKKYLFYAFSILALLLLYVALHKYIFSLFIQGGHLPSPEDMPGELSNDMPFRQHRVPPFSARRIILPFTQFFLFWILSTSYRLVIEWLSTNRENKKIKAEQSVLELAYLKAQINPHFFFNTLNTIYSLTLNGSDKATDAILLLSQIVRYVLDKIDTNLVPLEEEIEYINNYIDLQCLRYPKSLHVEFEIKGDVGRYKIAPLIFISFIENAFQYGVSGHYPSTIFVCLEAAENYIHFISKNKIYKKDEHHAGRNIGIKNVKKKLDIMYPSRYKLLLTEADAVFCVDLIIYDADVIS